MMPHTPQSVPETDSRAHPQTSWRASFRALRRPALFHLTASPAVAVPTSCLSSTSITSLPEATFLLYSPLYFQGHHLVGAQ